MKALVATPEPRSEPTSISVTARSGRTGTAKIYENRLSDGRTVWQVAYYSNGRRHRHTFADREKAETEAQKAAQSIASGSESRFHVSAAEVATLQRALELLRPTGTQLEVACGEYAEARKLLGSDGLLEAVRYFVKHSRRSAPSKTVEEITNEFLAEKEARARSETYLADLRYRLGRFCAGFGPLKLEEVTTNHFRTFLDGLGLSPRSYNKFFDSLRTLTRFAARRDYLPAGWRELERIERKDAPTGDTLVWTVDEFRSLLAHADENTRRVLAIQGFAGIRTEECLRLTWEDFDFTEGLIRVTAGKAKTRSRRLAPLLPVLRDWLGDPKALTGRVWPHSKPYLMERFYDAADAAGLKWKQNASRHSFVSYRLADTDNENTTAQETGHSPSMLHRHYKALVSKKEARSWFEIRPARESDTPSSDAPVANPVGEFPTSQ